MAASGVGDAGSRRRWSRAIIGAMADKILIAEKIADAGIEMLAEEFEVEVALGLGPEELQKRIADAAALIVRSATQVDAALLAAAPQLRVVGRAGIGVDNIDLATATDNGVLVVNAPTANTISAAEHTMALLLAQARRVPFAHDSLRGGKWERSKFQGVELHGKTLAVLGLGRIGTLVAQRASAFGMKIIAYDPYVAEERAARIGVEMRNFRDALKEADFITVHLPRTRETEHMLDEAALATTKPGVRIVNVARGGIVDEDALAAACESGHVAGAAVDVYASEPTTESPLFELDNVVVTPHLGASTREAQDKAGTSVAQAVAGALRGELPPSSVNLDMGPPVPDELSRYLPLAEQLGKVFVEFARGLPATLDVVVAGHASTATRPIAMGALCGALRAVTEEPVTYVNVTRIAEDRGVRLHEIARGQGQDYRSSVHITGEVDGRPRSVSGTILARKGPVLTELDGYSVEAALTEHMLLVINDDRPGMIGQVGTLLGDAGANIANMTVGRHPAGDKAVMGISLDAELSGDTVDRILEMPGIETARFIDFGRSGEAREVDH